MGRFPLPWEQVRWQALRFAMSDFRVVTRRGQSTSGEIALHDVATIEVVPSWLERLTGVGTLVIRSARAADWPLRVRAVFRARRTALTLSLLIADIRGIPLADETVDALPLPSIWRVSAGTRLQAALVAPSLLIVLVIIILIGLSGHQMHVAFAADDPIRPNGHKRGRADIVAFMEAEVMPFARHALGPVVGRDKVRCETCHGDDAEARDWQMPAVTALPEPAVRRMATTAGSDSQVRNALHGYLAEEEKQHIATHMRGVVLPGMAALLRRPVYNFARVGTKYNRERSAFGCYHCHMVKE